VLNADLPRLVRDHDPPSKAGFVFLGVVKSSCATQISSAIAAIGRRFLDSVNEMTVLGSEGGKDEGVFMRNGSVIVDGTASDYDRFSLLSILTTETVVSNGASNV
jgi:hypothetical protein